VVFDPDKIIDVATRLKAAKENVAAIEAELLNLIYPKFIPGSVRGAVAAVPSTSFRVLNLFNADPGKNFGAEEVWRKLNLKESYVRPLLSRLVKDGKIEKRGRGAYGALNGGKQKSLESLDSRPGSVTN
jgi:hypothetical protein